jgi:predicted O-methyltransferase YrrM
MRRAAEFAGYNLAKKNDYYSPLPTESDLIRNVDRWNRPSALTGIEYDTDSFKALLESLIAEYGDELAELPSHDEIVQSGIGLGYAASEAAVLYMMIRSRRPRRYLEVGSGVSTVYAARAAARNADVGYPVELSCVEPFPSRQLRGLPGITLRVDEVQDVDLATFRELAAGDILFIDSSHVVKIDGDVPYLFLEVLPNLQPGVLIHIDDVHFPYNTPYPAEHWVLRQSSYPPIWPKYWTEAMLLQALLCFSDGFRIAMSLPLIRHHDPTYLAEQTPFASPAGSAIWLEKMG